MQSEDRLSFASVWRRRAFWVAVAAGPLVSLGYAYALGRIDREVSWFLSLLFYPVIEELTFRGVILGYLLQYPRLQKHDHIVSPANIITSILFASIHFVHHDPITAVGVFFPSLVFGYFREVAGSVLVSIGLHMYYNLCFIALAG